MKWIKGLTIVAALATAVPAAGQSALSNARSLGMAGAYSAVARGDQAIAVNPANLGLRTNTSFSLSLPAIGFGSRNNAFGFADYKRYNGVHLNSTDKQDILAKIPEDGLGLYFDGDAEILAFSIKRFALRVSAKSASDLYLPKALVDLALHGNALDTEYDFSSSTGEALGYVQTSFAYGHPIDVPFLSDFAVGTAVSYILGIGHAQVMDVDATINTNFSGLHANANTMVRTALGGTGYAVDFGASGYVNNRWMVSLAFNNAINAVNWQTDVRIFEFGIIADSITAEAFSDSDTDSLFRDYDAEYEGETFSSNLPRTMRFGTAYTFGKLLVAADYVQGFNETAGASKKPIFATGLEARYIPFLPVRFGMAFGGGFDYMTTLGAGLQLGGFSINFATMAHGGFAPGSGKGLGFAFGMNMDLH